MASLPEVGLTAVIQNLDKFEAGAKSITKAYDSINVETDKVTTSSSKMGGIMDSLGSALGTVGNIALGATVAGITAVAGGMVAGAAAGLSFNNSMELARARLSSFLPSAEDVEKVLADLQVEAAKTPFSFQDMTDAAASLIPAVEESGMSLEELIQTAEILAASNPLEGLEGASFSLREAISGDTTSIIERFNLSRSAINDFKDQGLTAFEAVIAVMDEMGLSSELVSNLAETLTGRWSTFTDTLTTFFGVATQPIFDALSSGLGVVNELLGNNQEWLLSVSTILATTFADAITVLQDFGSYILLVVEDGDTLNDWLDHLPESVQPVAQFIGEALVMFGQLSDWFTNIGLPAGVAFWETVQTKTQEALDFLKPYWADLVEVFNQFIVDLLPPLQAAWLELQSAWVNEILPAVSDLIAAFGGAASGVDFWQIALGILRTALDLVVISIKILTPIIEAMTAVTTTTISGFTSLLELTTSIRGAFDTLTGTISDLSKKTSDFSKTLFDIVLPDWLMPGSPTPFELGLIGIGAAVTEQVDPSLTTLGDTLDTVFANWGILATDTRKDMLLLRDDVTKVDQSLVTMNFHVLNIGVSFNTVTIASSALIVQLNQIVSSLVSVKNSANSAVTSMNALVAVSFSTMLGQVDSLRSKVDNLAGAFDEAESKAKDLKNVSFSPMQSALDAINNTIGKIISSFDAMADAASNAANAANNATDGGTSGLSLGSLATAQLIPGTVAGPAVTNITNNYFNTSMSNDFGGNVINGEFDQARFDQMVLRSLDRLLR